eukprot:2561381-Pyramimonas_sp.AAC.1
MMRCMQFWYFSSDIATSGNEHFTRDPPLFNIVRTWGKHARKRHMLREWASERWGDWVPKRPLKPLWQGSHGGFGSCRHTPHMDRGPMGNPTEGASGRVRMAASGHVGTPLRRIVVPSGATPKAPAAGFAWRPRAISAHLSQGWLPHGGVHRRRQWQGSHGGIGPFRHTSREDRGPIGGSTERPNGRVSTAASDHVDTPLTMSAHPASFPLRGSPRTRYSDCATHWHG